MKIKVILTGGTIGSAERDGVLDTDTRSGGALVASYRAQGGAEAEFETEMPVQMLSENVSISALMAVADAVKAALKEDGVKGVIVTHGTDTLDFTARYLGLLFADTQIPIVLVSSLFPLGHKDANGQENFAAAVKFIADGGAGAVIAWGDTGKKAFIFPMLSLKSVGDYSAEFCASPVSLNQPRSRNVGMQSFSGRLDSAVLSVKCRALTDFSYYRLKGVHAVVVEPYHSGTVCTTGRDTDFLRFVSRCRRADIPVIMAPLAKREIPYAGSEKILNQVIPVYGADALTAAVIAMMALADGITLNTELFA